MSTNIRSEITDLFTRQRLVLIAGPCVIESYELCHEVASAARQLAQRHGMGFIFKASFDKANRTSLNSFRGPGLRQGLKILSRLKDALGLAVLTDIHEPHQAVPTAEVVDILQIPAFLCRQTDLIVAAAQTGKATNIKKGQFLAPEDMVHAVHKHRQSGGGPVSVTERGTTFGYQNLVVDMRGLALLRQLTQAPVVFDATHSVQKPGMGGGVTQGERHFAPVLARAAAAVGMDGLFCEVHPDPDRALSDGPNCLSYELLDIMLREVSVIDAARRQVLNDATEPTHATV